MKWSTQPFGPANENVAGKGRLDRFLVPSAYSQKHDRTFMQEPAPQTSYGSSFQDLGKGRTPEETRKGQEQLELAASLTRASRIPLGKMGFQDIPVRSTTYQDNFIKHHSDSKENKAKANRLKDFANLPSVSVGTIAPNLTDAFVITRKELKDKGRI